MQFSHSNPVPGRKAGKFALIAGLHVAAGVLFVQGMNMRHFALPTVPDDLKVVFNPDPPAPAMPLDPPTPVRNLAPPDKVFVPPILVDVAPPAVPTPLVTTDVAPKTPDGPPATGNPPSTQSGATATSGTSAGANAGQIRTAVFADAHGCALPAYPAVAARNGDAGTTTLALLVGADGRVASARVERSSGSRELDRAALHALSLCKFKPATNNGVAESGWARLAYVWTLD